MNNKNRLYKVLPYFIGVSLLLGCTAEKPDKESDGESNQTQPVIHETTVETDEAVPTYRNGDTIVIGSHASEVLSPLREPMLDWTVSLMQSIYDTYLSNGTHQVVLSIVPDKNVYLQNEPHAADIPFAEYDHLVSKVRDGCAEFANYVDLFSVLSLSDYYYTDIHWKPSCLPRVASRICDAFGIDAEIKSTEVVSNESFVGTYTAALTESGQLDIVGTDTLSYFEDDVLSHVTVTDYKDGTPSDGVLYNPETAKKEKSYDFYLSGSIPLQVLHSPNAATEKSLVIFRDSFASSLAPLFCHIYQTVTLVDLRYISSAVLGDYIDFTDQDILFLYSTHIINRSMVMK